MNYAEALSAAQSARDKQAGKPVGNNTRLVLAGTDDQGRPVVQLRLHGSAVVEYQPDGSVILDSCGYKTVTTKDRINHWQNLCRVYSERGSWYLHAIDGETVKVPFRDGVRVYPDGRVEGAGDPVQPKREQQLRGRIGGYVRGYIEALFGGKVPAPSGADCWYCVLNTHDGKSLGETTGNKDHLLSHVEESYYVPSLMIRAYNAAGGSQAAGWIIGTLFRGEEVKKWEVEYGKRELASYLRRYLARGLGLSA